MHQWIKAILCQEVKQMTPTHLRDKGMSGKCRKPRLKLSKTCQFQYLIPIQSRQCSGHRRDSPPSQRGRASITLETGRVHTPQPHEKSRVPVCAASSQAGAWRQRRASQVVCWGRASPPHPLLPVFTVAQPWRHPTCHRTGQSCSVNPGIWLA